MKLEAVTNVLDCSPGQPIMIPEPNPWALICDARRILCRALDGMQGDDTCIKERGLLIEALQRLMEISR